MTKNEFEKLFGKIRIAEPANTRLKECKMVVGDGEIDWNDSPDLFDGNIWTIGYYRNGENPLDMDLDWDVVEKNVRRANRFAKPLRKICHSTETDCPYFPFVLRGKPVKEDELSDWFPKAMGVAKPDNHRLGIFGDFYILDCSHTKSIFIASGNEKWEPWADVLKEEELSEYYSDEELKAFSDVTKRMRDELKYIKKISIGVSEYGRGFVAYPVFWIGEDDTGNLTGLFSISVET